MNVSRIAGLILIFLPVAFNAIFFLLQRSFDYPDILRQPTDHILKRFHEGGRPLRMLWYAFMATGIVFLPAAILVPQVVSPADALFVASATAAGILAGLVQVLGLIRWPFVVPYLASTYADPNASQSTRDAVAVVFQGFHRYAGVAIGEHLGYLFTSLWTLLIAIGLIQSAAFPAWLGWAGVFPAVGVLIGVLEETGFKPAGAINAISYVVWSIWLIIVGVFFLLA